MDSNMVGPEQLPESTLSDDHDTGSLSGQNDNTRSSSKRPASRGEVDVEAGDKRPRLTGASDDSEAGQVDVEAEAESTSKQPDSDATSSPPTTRSAYDSRTAVGTGWNQGINGGLRISFCGASTASTTTPVMLSVHSSPPHTVSRQGKKWTLPSIPDTENSSMPWDERIEAWATDFVEQNAGAVHKLKAASFQALALDIFDQAGFSKNQKKYWRSALSRFIRQGGWDKQLAARAEARPQTSGEENAGKCPTPDIGSSIKPTEVPPTDSNASGPDGDAVMVTDSLATRAEPTGEDKNMATPPPESEAPDLNSEDEAAISHPHDSPCLPHESEDEGMATESSENEAESHKSTHVKSQDVDVDELENTMIELRRFYPTRPDCELCTVCRGCGHNRDNCPYRTCGFCGKTDAHIYLACPLRIRCEKCQLLGHKKAACTETLKAGLGDGYRCKFCDGDDHFDSECDRLWRTSRPTPDQAGQIGKVKYIPAWCTLCGKQGHYRTACSLNTKRVTPADYSWTEECRALYTDPGSDSLTVEQIFLASRTASRPTGPPHTLGISIKGKARHVEYTDDDESEDEGLIRASVQKQQPRAQMKISTNIQSHPASLPPRPPANAGGNGGFSSLRRGGSKSGSRGGFGQSQNINQQHVGQQRQFGGGRYRGGRGNRAGRRGH